MSKVAEYVAENIIAELDKGVIPWVKAWSGGDKWSVSHLDGKRYKLINQILLGEPGEYITWNQIQKEGGKLKKGAKSKMVVYNAPTTPKPKDGETEEEAKQRTYWVLKYYRVFNVKDCEGIEAKYWKGEPELVEHETVDEAVEMVNSYAKRNPGLKMRLNDVVSGAWYSPKDDEVQVPCAGQFKDVAEWVSTLMHELAHSTGHASRMNRLKAGKAAMFGSEDYGFEELVAEMSSAYLSSLVGVNSEAAIKNQIAYIQAWRDSIKANPEMVVRAASVAEKAVDFFLNGFEKSELVAA